MHTSILRYRGGRYLWWATAIILCSIALYGTQRGLQRPSGGTWQGYVLGTLAAVLIVWLTLLGLRKRSYRSSLGTVEGWTSAHVYLGIAVVLIATLHCAFHFGWNVHTLAYLLMSFVVASGVVGLYLYLHNPVLLSDIRAGGSRALLFAELFELDEQARELAKKCDPVTAMLIRSSIERTTIGGGSLAQLLGLDRSKLLRADPTAPAAAPVLVSNQDQQAAIDYISDRLPQAEKRAEPSVLQSLTAVLCRRQVILRRIRRDIALGAWLKAWLSVHVPLTFALLSALTVHIIVTFIYW
jgi:hypothetical protein